MNNIYVTNYTSSEFNNISDPKQREYVAEYKKLTFCYAYWDDWCTNNAYNGSADTLAFKMS